MSALLEVDGLSVAYGHIEAVRGVSFRLRSGAITALVGANGAGKSTTLLALSGLLRPTAGRVIFDGEDISRLRAHRIVRHGIVQVAEGRAILASLTVRENLALGAYTRRDRTRVGDTLAQVFHLFPPLEQRAGQYAGNLSGGEQQMLAIGRALMARPRLLLLDEPSMGLAPIVVQQIFRTLVEINRSGITILLVEQNVRQALKIAAYGYVIENGRIALDGEAASLLGNPKVVEHYLGG
jgi:branched-chain amino acid transport system ATP-binding protein